MSPSPFAPTAPLTHALVPQPYHCDRCGLNKVGYMDVENNEFVGFYAMGKRPDGTPGHPELRPFTRKVTVTHKRVARTLTPGPAGRRIPQLAADAAGDPLVETVEETRDEYTVCAECMHLDPVFVAAYPAVQAMQARQVPLPWPVLPGHP